MMTVVHQMISKFGVKFPWKRIASTHAISFLHIQFGVFFLAGDVTRTGVENS
jgi:hypothetical protein